MAYGRRSLACGMARVDKPCATCRVPSMEGAPQSTLGHNCSEMLSGYRSRDREANNASAT